LRRSMIHTLSLHDALPIFGGQEEAGFAGVALATRATSQLVVDAPRLVPLGAADKQPAGGQHALAAVADVAVELGDQLHQPALVGDRKSTRLNSSHEWISYA